MAIENGGDDYITKPFHFEVVLAKIKSVLRRTYGEYAGHAATTRDVYDVGGLYLLRGEHAMEWDGKRLELSKKEFLLLDCLAQRVNSYVPRDTLLETLWDAIDFVDDNTLSVNVARVRKKLAQLGAHHAIETKRGAGYRLVYSGGSSE